MVTARHRDDVGKPAELYQRVVLIYNPTSYPSVLSAAIRDDLRRRLPDLAVTMQPTHHAGHARELAAAEAATTPVMAIGLKRDKKGTVKELG